MFAGPAEFLDLGTPGVDALRNRSAAAHLLFGGSEPFAVYATGAGMHRHFLRRGRL